MNGIELIIAFGITAAATPLIRSVATRRGWLARPVKDRWHEKPTALLGGTAIFAGMTVPLLVRLDLTAPVWVLSAGQTLAKDEFASVVVLGAAALFLLGLVDDFVRIKPHTKLVGQILVASMVALLGIRLNWFHSLTLDTMVTIVWIVGITNAFNLIDNMDGLCAGIGAIASGFLAFLFWQSHPGMAVVALMLAGALAGFLIYNFNPASIFMGDCGSLPIGFSLSMLALFYSEAGMGHPLSRVAVPVLVLMVPILDTTLVTLIRLLSGRRASTGGRDHTSHRLVLTGMSEKRAAAFLYGIGAVSGVAAVLVHGSDTLSSPVVIVPVLLALLLMGIYLAQLRVYPEKEFSLLRDRTFTPVLIELTYKRQLMLVILDFGLIAFAYYLSYRLRFDANAFPVFFKVFLRSLPMVIACKFVAFFSLGVYHGIWGQMSTDDVFVALKASSLATLLSVAAVTYLYRFESFSKGIFVIDWLLTTGFLLGTRGSFRIFLDILKRQTLAGQRVYIYGAGRGGEILLREMLNNQGLHVHPVGFIDDDPLKTGRKLLGVPIVGSFRAATDSAQASRIDGVVISFDGCSPDQYTAVKQRCRENRWFLKRFSIGLEDIDLESP